MNRTLTADQRGMAINLIVFGLSIIIAAALIVLLEEPMNQIIAQGQESTSTQAAADGWTYIDTAWDAYPLFVLILALIQLVVAANFKRGRGV